MTLLGPYIISIVPSLSIISSDKICEIIDVDALANFDKNT